MYSGSRHSDLSPACVRVVSQVCNPLTVKAVLLMFSSRNRRLALGAWFALFVGLAGAAALSGSAPTMGAGAFWFAACVVPPAVMLAVWRGAPSLTVAEVLHAVDAQGGSHVTSQR